MARPAASWIASLAALAAALIGIAVWRCQGRTSPEGGQHVRAGGTTEPPGPSGRDPGTLGRGAILGVVTAEAGGPVVRARVCAAGASDELPGDVLREPACTTTDAAGRYELVGLLPARYIVSASAPTFRPAVYARRGSGADRSDARTEVVLAAGGRAAGIDLVLRAGGVELTGVVLDVTGGPIVGARVRATSGDRGEPVAWTASGADGRFAISVAPGGAWVVASAEGYAEGSAGVEAPGSVEVLLTPESSLAGTIVDATTGAPIEGARVTIASGEAFERAGGTVRSAADGTFRVARLPPGRYAVHAASRRGVGRSEGSVLVGLGEHVDGVVVRLSPAYRLEGTIVIAPGGERCTRGDLSLHDPERTLWIDTRRADDGTVYAEGLLPGTYRVHVECEGYRSRSYPAITIADADVTGQVWEVEPGATLRGRIRTRAGAPVEHATVSARSDSDAWARDETDAEGRYELVGLAAGTYRLRVDSRHGLAPPAAEAVVPKTGVVERDLVLEDGAVIAGTVVDTRGAPVPDVTVASRRSATGWGEEARTDARGTFRLPPQPPGQYHVIAQRGNVPLAEPGAADRGTGVRVTVQAGETTDVRLVVEPQTLAITGVVLDARGAPVPDAFVAVARESGDGASSIGATRWTWAERPVLTGTDGRFTVARLAAGTYTVRAFRKDGGEAVAEHVAAGSHARLQIEPVGSIEGVARRGDATRAIDELSIRLVDRTTGFTREEQFLRTDGRFALRDLPAGAFTLTARARGALAQVPIELAEGEVKTGVTVVLAGVVDLTGRLVDLRTRAPIPGVRMMAALASSHEFSFVPEPDRANITDAAGRFTIRGAPTGRVAIRAWTRGSDYVLVHGVVTIGGSTDVGEIGLLRRRVAEGQPVGEHGIRWAADPNQQTVAAVAPRGPAARAGLVAGDVVVAIDGIDVRGDHGVRVPALCHAPPGTTLTLTLARGAIVPVTLAAP